MRVTINENLLLDFVLKTDLFSGANMNKIACSILSFLTGLVFFFSFPVISKAQELVPHTHPDRPHLHEELQQIRLWLESIERDTERRRITGEKENVAVGSAFLIERNDDAKINHHDICAIGASFSRLDGTGLCAIR